MKYTGKVLAATPKHTNFRITVGTQPTCTYIQTRIMTSFKLCLQEQVLISQNSTDHSPPCEASMEPQTCEMRTAVILVTGELPIHFLSFYRLLLLHGTYYKHQVYTSQLCLCHKPRLGHTILSLRGPNIKI